MPGTYSILNVALTLVLLEQLRIPADGFIEVLKTFTGVGRRFEISETDTAIFVDDFAHHPTQVRNLIRGLRQFFPDREILAVFEPRQYHLVRTFLREYGKAFASAKEVCVTSLVPALGDTKEDIESLTSEDVIRSVSTYSRPESVWFGSSYEEIADRLKLRDLSNTVVATIGAGNIYQVRDLVTNRVQ
jgi:UDP-N-acetylmuramate--alanine ligase